MQGSLSILNTGAGDIEMKFNKDNQQEVDKAKEVITDMLRRGYAIFIEDAMGETYRVTEFDPQNNCYIIKDAPQDEPVEEAEQAPGEEEAAPAPKKRGRKAVHVTEAKATAVGRSAGG
jgi:hypothetical protein